MHDDISYGISDIGLVRTNNEDVWAQMPKHQFYILADGMGGHQAGEIAANEAVMLICTKIREHFSSISSPHPELLQNLILEANRHVYTMSQEEEDLKGMGTTLCMALVLKNRLITAHVGDSRLYRYRKGVLEQLTQDHCLKEELLASGDVSEAEAVAIPKNVITRAIGIHPNVIGDVQEVAIEEEDLFLLCTDGLTDCVEDRDILKIMRESPGLKLAAEKLVERAKRQGGGDNITLVLFKPATIDGSSHLKSTS